MTNHRSIELLAYWTPTGRTGVSNGPTEATNALIKKVKRGGHGFRNFDNYRLRLLLARRSRLAHRALAGFTRHPGPKPLITLRGVEPEKVRIVLREHSTNSEANFVLRLQQPERQPPG